MREGFHKMKKNSFFNWLPFFYVFIFLVRNMQSLRRYCVDQLFLAVLVLLCDLKLLAFDLDAMSYKKYFYGFLLFLFLACRGIARAHAFMVVENLLQR